MIDFIELELIVFHDIPVKNLNIINGVSKNLVLEMFLYDEDIQDYIDKTIIFGEINHINPENIYIENFNELEIYSFDYYLMKNFFHGNLKLLLGLNKPDFNIEFSCKTVKVK